MHVPRQAQGADLDPTQRISWLSRRYTGILGRTLENRDIMMGKWVALEEELLLDP